MQIFEVNSDLTRRKNNEGQIRKTSSYLGKSERKNPTFFEQSPTPLRSLEIDEDASSGRASKSKAKDVTPAIVARAYLPWRVCGARCNGGSEMTVFTGGVLREDSLRVTFIALIGQKKAEIKFLEREHGIIRSSLPTAKKAPLGYFLKRLIQESYGLLA